MRGERRRAQREGDRPQDWAGKEGVRVNKPVVLVVEDDKSVRKLMSATLQAHNYRFIEAASGQEALLNATSHHPDIAMLDLGLPDMDGVEVIRAIRSWSNMPIVVISARSEDTDKIGALDAGADDYLVKPFSVDELLARLRAIQRRLVMLKSGAASSPVFVNGGLRVDYAARRAYIQDREIHLTPIEYKLLCLLCQNAGKVLTYPYLTEKIWGASWRHEVANLRVFMATLRRKLESEPGSPQYIQTHIGVGYRMITQGT